MTNERVTRNEENGKVGKGRAGTSRTKGEDRVQRGIRLAAERGEEIVRLPSGLYQVPSVSRPGLYHSVDIETDPQTCSCEDYTYHGNRCLHITAAGCIAAGLARKTAEQEADLYRIEPGRRDLYGNPEYRLVRNRDGRVMGVSGCHRSLEMDVEDFGGRVA